MKNSIFEKITILRPLLILLIVTTHIQGSLYGSDLSNINLTFENFFHALLSSSIATSALPLLSVISGYLAAITYERNKYHKIINKKFYRILIPMIFWNLILAIYIYQSQAKGLPRRPDLILYPFNIKEWTLGTLSLFKLPANQPLYFLKELFICFLILPILNKISKIKVLTLISLAIISYMSVKGINLNLLIHRIDIYGFFIIGLFIYNKNNKNNKNNKKELSARIYSKTIKITYILLYIFISILFTIHLFKSDDPNNIYYIKLMTLIGPVALWFVSSYIKGTLKNFLTWISPASFPVFLGHILILNIFWDEWSSYFKSTPLTENYWVFWISSILICFTLMGSIAFIYRKSLILIKKYRIFS